jgi:hypothetical protein
MLNSAHSGVALDQDARFIDELCAPDLFMRHALFGLPLDAEFVAYLVDGVAIPPLTRATRRGLYSRCSGGSAARLRSGPRASIDLQGGCNPPRAPSFSRPSGMIT